MTFLPFIENNLWGVKIFDSLQNGNKDLLHPIYNRLSVFLFRKENLIYSFESTSKKQSEEKIEMGYNDEVIFLVKKDYETFLLKKTRNSFNSRNGVVNLYTEFETLESYKLLPSKPSIQNKIRYENDFAYIGKYYNDIVPIGKGCFKVEIVTVVKGLEPVNEDGDYAWRHYFDSDEWSIIDHNGNPIGEKLFNEVQTFREDLCKVRRGDRWNFIDKTGRLILKEWHSHLEYPFDDNKFLAGKRTYLISISIPTLSLFRTTDFFLEDEISTNIHESEFSLKINRTSFSAPDFEQIFKRVFGSDNFGFDFEEVVHLDLYNTSGFVKCLGFTEVYHLNENINIAKVDSMFLCHFVNETSIRIIRHKDLTVIHACDLLSFEFEQIRLIDKNLNFIGKNYYHEISHYTENGLLVVAKNFFEILYGNEDATIIDLLDASLDDVEVRATSIEAWIDFAGMREPILRWGAIDKYGNEIFECKYDQSEINILIQGYQITN